MITEEKLQEAIAECWGEREPNANTCYKLAAYYTILNEMRANGSASPVNYPLYSNDGLTQVENSQDIVDFDSDSDFAQAVNGRNAADVWAIMDELMATISVTNPRLYNAVMRKLRE